MIGTSLADSLGFIAIWDIIALGGYGAWRLSQNNDDDLDEKMLESNRELQEETQPVDEDIIILSENKTVDPDRPVWMMK